ncbi:MAG: archaellar assembly protein FlaJ [Halovenus sp.]
MSAHGSVEDDTDEGDQTETADRIEIDVQEFVLSLVDSYRYMQLPLRQYVLLALIPTFLLAISVPVITLLLGVSPVIALPLSLLGVFSFFVVAVYPKIVQDRKRKEIRERFHLFLTHITVLSMTNIDRIEVFRRLAQIDEYGALAEEMGRVVALVDTWNQSLDDACQRRSKRVSSDLLSDFFERLAYTVSAGQDMSEFLISEQDSIVQQFVIQYESDLSKLDVMKELYLSMMMSTTFILVFATVLPILIAVSPTLLVSGVIGMFVVVQGGFLFIIHAVSPRDPVWFIADEGRSPVRRTWPFLAIGLALSAVAVVFTLSVTLGIGPVPADVFPRPIWMAVCVTPLVVPGLAMRHQEQKVKDRDDGFPSFIRALGGIESVKESSTASVLSTLRTKEFGTLTSNVDALYKRLNTRIDTARAWRLFAVETGSYLIQKFGDMYVVGRRMGGDPKQLGQIISTNFNKVLSVREKRAQATSTFVGVIYGVTAAAIFSAFISLEIAIQMVEISTDLEDSGTEIASLLFSTDLYDIDVIEYLLLLVVLFNALLSSLMIRLMDRGHPISGFFHFVALIWVGSVVAVVSRQLMGGLL